MTAPADVYNNPILFSVREEMNNCISSEFCCCMPCPIPYYNQLSSKAEYGNIFYLLSNESLYMKAVILLL